MGSSTLLYPKAGAKVLLFFYIPKYFVKKSAFFCILPVKPSIFRLFSLILPGYITSAANRKVYILSPGAQYITPQPAFPHPRLRMHTLHPRHTNHVGARKRPLRFSGGSQDTTLFVRRMQKKCGYPHFFREK